MTGFNEGSVRCRILDVLGPATEERRRGLVSSEVVDLLAQGPGQPIEPRTVASALSALHAKDLVTKTGGRLRKTRWALAGFKEDSAGALDPAQDVLQVVALLTSELGRAVTTAEVTARWAAGNGPPLDSEQLRMMLVNLANDTPSKRAHAPPEWKTPRVTRFSGRSVTGQPRVFWAPAGSAAQPPRYLSPVDAALEVVVQAEARLGRPVSLPEATLWMKAAAGGEFGAEGVEVVQALEGYTFKGGIRSLARRYRVGRQQRAELVLREIPPWMIAKSSYHSRFTAQEPDSARDSAARLEDGVNLLRPARELEAIERLQAEWGWLDCPLRKKIGETRLGLVIRELRRFAPDATSDMASACRACADARGPLKRWVSHAGMKPWFERLEVERLEGEAQTFQIVETLLLRTSADLGMAVGIRAISEVIGAPRTHFDHMIEEAARLVGSPSNHHHARILEARRILSRPPGAASPQGCGKYYRDVGIDRPDAIALIARQSPLPRLNSWVASGQELLGFVLRDPDWVLGMLKALPSPAHDLRPGLVAALGLMGTVPPIELACPLPGDFEAMSSYLWALALGEDCEEKRIELAEEADLYADGATRDLTESALGRLEQGHRLQVLG